MAIICVPYMYTMNTFLQTVYEKLHQMDKLTDRQMYKTYSNILLHQRGTVTVKLL